MKHETIEPGLLAVFRLLTVLWLATEVLTLVIRVSAGEIILSPVDFLFDIADNLLLLVYLYVPFLQRRLGAAYLPIGIIIATAGPVLMEVAIHTGVFIDQTRAVYVFRAREITLSPPSDTFAPLLFNLNRVAIPVAYIPLILTAWQYGMRGVIMYCIGYAGLSFLGRDQGLVNLFGFGSVLLINLMRTIGFALIGYMVAQLMAEQRKRRDALAEANQKLVRFASTLEQLSSSRERIRLAHELHDTLAHTQSALAVQLEGVDALWHDEPDEAYVLLQKSVANTRAGLVETRRALQALRASPLDELGLVLAIGELAESAAERGGFQLAQSLPKQIDTISPDIEQCIYRTAQEALENVVRHAQAERVSLTLEQAASGVRLVIHDDGTGFDPASVDSEAYFGLRGMGERARMVNGSLQIDSQQGQGTRICLQVEDYHDSRADL